MYIHAYHDLDEAEKLKDHSKFLGHYYLHVLSLKNTVKRRYLRS